MHLRQAQPSPNPGLALATWAPTMARLSTRHASIVPNRHASHTDAAVPAVAALPTHASSRSAPSRILPHAAIVSLHYIRHVYAAPHGFTLSMRTQRAVRPNTCG